MVGKIAIFEGYRGPPGGKMPRKRKGLSKSPFAVKARACRKKTRTPKSFWQCVRKGRGKAIGKGSCAHGRFKRGPRKGRCRDKAPAWARKIRRRAMKDD